MKMRHRLAGTIVTLLSALTCAAQTAAPIVMTLQQLFDIAETGSPGLRPALTAITEADAAVTEARMARLPDITAALTAGYIGDGFTTKRNFSDYRRAPIPHLNNGLSVDITQPVYAGGAITAGIDMARLQSLSARYNADIRRADIRLRLTGNYLDLYKTGNLRRVVDSNLDAALKVLDEMRTRYRVGTVLQNDITRYELLVSQLQLLQTQLDNARDVLTAGICTLAGLPAGTVILPDTTMLDNTVTEADSEAGWQATASERAPALRLAANALSISRKTETITRAQRLPSIGIQAGWNINGPILTEVPPIDRNLSYWFVGVGIRYNISSLFKTDKSLSVRRAATVRAGEQLEAVRSDVALGVHNDHANYITALSRLDTHRKAVELARRNYDITATRFSAGMALLTDMLDAANARLDAEQNLVNARLEIIYLLYKLKYTAGTI